ncbi:hypothetical protein [Pseudomonas sp. 5P_5.1_Bac1]|uniref:hypothetical protein n=1 Tax=Pseudomonas sp. 5P_5.1_Bac1 TaxID=2971616 RepID=UPI0021C8FA85|nr:hypothetical protein [Pseudomonas sp. 5P_5.1_Bac1]MCU1721540.1 hypothetical protein [Pseudomonas sp. 5P_5.1_Bac1]
MSSMFEGHGVEGFVGAKSMHGFGLSFIKTLPQHIALLKIPGRAITEGMRRGPLLAQIEHVTSIKQAMRNVLDDPITQTAQRYAESAFRAFLNKTDADDGVLKFFNGWNELHKTTSLVSAKIIMRLSADAVSMPVNEQMNHSLVMAHMHEVAKDDFGLGHEGHDGMYAHMTAAFGASDWVASRYTVEACNRFSGFLYQIGVAAHGAPMKSARYQQSMMDAMLVSVASELWNGREYNFLAQYIEEKLHTLNASFRADAKGIRNARAYVTGHSGDVENRHGLHALAAVQAFGRQAGLPFETDRMQNIMLDYNKRVGAAFCALCDVLM